MEVQYEVELKYKRSTCQDSIYSWYNDIESMSCPKVEKRHDLIELMLSDVSRLMSVGLNESDIYAHLEMLPATPRVRYSLTGNVPIAILSSLFKIDPTECSVECDKKDMCTLQFKGLRTV
jgi:hypothetical protein